MSKLWLPRGHAAERMGIDRRTLLAGGAKLGAGAVVAAALGGCDWRGPKRAQGLLSAAERWNERVERALFRHRAMNVAPPGAHAAGASFPSYFVSDAVPVWDEAERGTWRLEIGGMVRHPLRLTLAQLKDLPRTELRLEHFCVEGWSAVSARTGVRLNELARRVDVAPEARFVDFQSFDSGYQRELGSSTAPSTPIGDPSRPGRPAPRSRVRRPRGSIRP